MTPRISVVIPTFQGRSVLPRTIEGLKRQTLPPGAFELICVVDGSADGTAAWLKRQARSLPFRTRTLVQAHAGAGPARNRGADSAKATLVAYLGDDIVPDAYFLTSHLEAHADAGSRAAIGVTAWHPALPLTDTMRRIAPAGRLTAYHLIRDRRRLGHAFLYGSNLSMPSALARRFPFDPTFTGYGWEDTELGWRLERAGIPIVLAPRALGWHWHRYTRAEWARRTRQARWGRKIFLRLHPEAPRTLDRYLRAALAMTGRPA